MMQRLVNLVYPQQCICCESQVTGNAGICGGCWGDVHFIGDQVCDKCGVPLIGEIAGHCDDCLKIARPWKQARAAIVYEGQGRRLVLGLKHGDRTDLVPTLSRWVTQTARKIVPKDTIVVPVPLHWSRLLYRKYNQAELIATAVANELEAPCLPRALVRTKKTIPMKGLTRENRFELLSGAIDPHKRFGSMLNGRHVVLIDDVMTTGATLAACAEACNSAGALDVFVVTLARVQKDP